MNIKAKILLEFLIYYKIKRMYKTKLSLYMGN